MKEVKKINYSFYLTGFVSPWMLLVIASIVSAKKPSGRFGRKKSS
jgi:hypothetical protein